MANVPTVQERTMKVKEVLMRAVQREITWIQAADILGLSARGLRRWKVKFDAYGLEGLIDGGTRGHGGPRRVTSGELAPLLRLYRSRYLGLNVRHFCSIARREHGLQWSYSFVRQALQAAGLIKKRRPRGRHRLRRPPRECFGELLHLDGSLHSWLALRPQERHCLMVVVDDATRRLLRARLCGPDGIAPVLCARGGRRVARLGVEHILPYSPQARGRSERLNRTLQDRLIQELRLARIVTVERANRFIAETFLARYNEEFAIAPLDPSSAFVTAGGADLDQILCLEDTRVVGKDDVVAFEGTPLQIPKQPGRASCAGLSVLVRRHLDRTYSVWWAPRRLALYDGRGRLQNPAEGVAA